jgi:hypothetical protein
MTDGFGNSRQHADRDNIVTLPTEDLVVGDPRCCCGATAGGSPSMASTSGTAIWWKSRRA